jgi:prepilin peptidase CpaA
MPLPDIYTDLTDLSDRLMLVLTIGLFGLIAYGDLRHLRIPNRLCVAVALLGVLRLVITGDPIAAFYTLGFAIAIFLVSLLLFQRGIMGGGDAKLLPATILLIGYQDLLPFFMVMSIGGALLAVAVLIWHSKLPLYLGPRIAITIAPTRPKAVPYGVAIAAAAILLLLYQSSIIG